MTSPILFYGVRGEHGEFSNWFAAEFELDGLRWKTSEHYFMAQKTTDKRAREQIRKAKSPAVAKALGRAVKLRRDWDAVKFDVMVRACHAKFSQNPSLAAALLSTGDAAIHEDCDDPWWGGGPNHPDGRDLLGRALMVVRDRLRGKQA